MLLSFFSKLSICISLRYVLLHPSHFFRYPTPIPVFVESICMNDAHVFSRNGTTVHSIHPGDWLRNLKNWNSPNSTKSTEVSPKSHGNHMEITWKSHGNHMEITWKSPVSMKSEVPGLGVLDPTLPAHSSAWNGEAVLWVPCSRCLKFGVQCFKVSVTRQLHRFAAHMFGSWELHASRFRTFPRCWH